MPSLQSVSLTDRQSPTPIVHVFSPRGIDDKGVGLVVANPGISVAEERLTVSMRRSGSRFRGKLTIAIPQTYVPAGALSPVVDRIAYATVDITFDEKSTEQERKNLVGMLQSSLDPGKVLVNDCFIKLEGVYGA